MLNFAVIAPSMPSYVGLVSPLQGPAAVFTAPHIPPLRVQPPRAVQTETLVATDGTAGFNTPGGAGTSPIWLQLITCKAPAPFTENPFRKSWEIGNKFAVGWRGEARVLTSMRMLAGSPCTLARFIVYSYKL